ncbi:MAG: glutamate--cysteine ligase [Bdellovibrionota bacterium]
MGSFAETLADLLKAREREVQEWLAATRERFRPPFTTSVDLRDAGYKLAPVDTNIFPAGFNNLCEADYEGASATFRKIIGERAGSGVKSIGIVAESHTSNLPYFRNLDVLQKILKAAGYEVEVLSLSPELVRDVTPVPVEDGTLELHKARREGGRVGSANLRPDLLVLNNDLTTGIPPELSGVDQPLLPLPEFGWWRRKKGVHFGAYDSLVAEAAPLLGIDPWLLSTFQETVLGVDFDGGTGLEGVAEAVERVRAKTAAKYKEYGITESPYAIVKSNSGTYGMAVLPVESGEALLGLARKERKKMARGKGGLAVAEVIVQEGVPSPRLRGGKSAEPVFYLVGGEVVGGFFRVHASKGPRENLNSPGSEFRKICYNLIGDPATPVGEWSLSPAVARAYTFVSMVASLAAGRERLLMEAQAENGASAAAAAAG